jgi:hypothetical protein
MNNEFAMADLTGGQLNAIVKKLGGYDGAMRFLRGEVVVSEPTIEWREKDGVIYFTVISDGTSGAEWIVRLEGKGLRASDYAKQLLLSPNFKPTNGIVYEIAVLKGMLFNDGDRITTKIRAEADNRKLLKLNPEISCLIREKFSDKELEAMGLMWIVVMHEPIKDSGGGPGLLDVNRNVNGSWLSTGYDDPDCQWDRDYGCAFAVSQVELKA